MACSRSRAAILAAIALLAWTCLGAIARAELREDPNPPIPLHGFEGVGGVLITQSAYLVNPALEGDIFGLPSVGFAYVNLNHGRHLTATTITQTIGNRLELGYAWDRFDIGDLQRALVNAGLPRVNSFVGMHNFNARFALIKDGDFDIPLMPQVTAGVHFKYNHDLDNLDDDLGGAFTNAHMKHEEGVEGTLYASKLFKQFWRPVLVNVGARYSDAVQAGLLGFTRDYRLTPEASAVVLVMDKLGIGGEYRMKKSHIASIGKFVQEEQDWWTACACYVINNHLTVSGGYGHFGKVLNHRANAVWALRLKYEF